MSEGTKINCAYKFWCQHFTKGSKFEDSLLPVGLVTSAEQFWAFYQHIKRPSQLNDNSYIYLFKENIVPVWEDEHNKTGGAFVLRFQKDKCDRVWEDMLLALVGSSLEDVRAINGIRIKIRKDNAAEIDVWVADAYNQELLHAQREWVLNAASLDEDTSLEIIQFET